MSGTVHGVLQAMDSIAHAPALLAVRLLQPAPPRQLSQSTADLTPPRVVKRKRKLTLPLDTSAPQVSGKAKWFGKPVQQRTFDQRQSPLMRLPAELREEIWRYVILGTTDRQLGTDDNVLDIVWRSTGSGRGRASAFKVSFERQRDQWGLGVLGMLCSCRIIYSETIDLLYSLPTFSFQNQNVETFLAFIGATLQHRRDQIRYLDLRLVGLPMHDPNTRTPEHSLNTKWSYGRINNIKALSGLPDLTKLRTEDGYVCFQVVIEEILQGMKGLDKGGVNWGSRSTGCFAEGQTTTPRCQKSVPPGARATTPIY